MLPSEEDIKKLAKRIPKVTQELEAESLDLVLYCKALSLGKFPDKHILLVSKNLQDAHTELGRIIKVWNEMFESVTGGNK